MTPAEAANAARELAEWLDRLAILDSHPTTNADLIYQAWGEIKELTTALSGYIEFYPVNA